MVPGFGAPKRVRVEALGLGLTEQFDLVRIKDDVDLEEMSA